MCGFWFLPNEWQFSCNKCGESPSSAGLLGTTDDSHACADHTELYAFVSDSLEPALPIFIGLSSIGSMGFMKNPLAFLRILESVIQITGYRFILLTAGYEPLEAAICTIAQEPASSVGVSIFNGKLFCFSGMVPYNWLFRRCAAAIHHGGSGSTAAALHAGIPQIICPFMMDQFYWAEKMTWLGVAPQPLARNQLLPEESNDDERIMEAAQVVAKAVYDALSSKARASAMAIAETLSLEDGVSEAVRVLREEVCEVSGSNKT